MNFDADELRQAWDLLVTPGDIIEIRVLDGMDRTGGRKLTWSGYFDNAGDVLEALKVLRGGWHGVYMTINPVDPLLFHKRANRIQPAEKGDLTNDLQIIRRRWIPLDFDPIVWGTSERIFKIASTDAEKAHTVERALLVAGELVACGWPEPILGDSGNGTHLLVRVDLGRDAASVEAFIKLLAKKYGDDPGNGKDRPWNRAATVDVDTTVYNPARIWKLYGTIACKGAGVGDRPHRMARVVSVPPGGAELLDVNELDAWIAAATPVPAAPDKPQARQPSPSSNTTVGPHSPAVPFDALAIVRAAGLVPGEGRTRSDGATFHELEECMCDRRETGAFVSIATSGAVGIACQHASCEWSKSKGTPGQHWGTFREAHAPRVPRVTTAERIASVAAYTERMGAKAPSFDVGAFTDDQPTTAPPAAPHAPRASPPLADDAGDRRRINVNQDSRDLRDEVLRTLAADPAIYVSQGKLARADRFRMEDLYGGSLDSAVVDACEIVKWTRSQSTGEFVAKPETLPVRIRGMLENLTVKQRADFRQVDQVTSAPFFTPQGRPITGPAPYYSPEARTLLVDCPEIEEQPEPDGRACLAYFRELLADFPFEGGVHGAEFANFIGAMLVPMVRPMIATPVPLLLIEGNRPGTGKTLLAKLLQVVHGLPAEVGTLPRDEKVIAALLLSILVESKAMHVFDNVKHAVVSEALDTVLTGESYTDRVLGASKSPSFAVRQLWIMTSNNAKFSQDMGRRMFRVRLNYSGEHPETRRDIRIGNLLDHVRQNRPAILSRLVQLVREWVDARMPMPAELPTMGTFEDFARVIGGILWHAGEYGWLANLAEAKESVALEDDFGEFLHTWHAELFTWGRVSKKPQELWEFARTKNLLGSILGEGGNEAAQVRRLGAALKSRKDQVLYGFRLTGDRNDRGQWSYLITSQPQQLSLH